MDKQGPSVTSEVAAGTKLAAVAEAIRRRAALSSEGRVKLTGAEIAQETGLRLNQVHDAIFALVRKGVIMKERPGARYRPMIVRLTEAPIIPAVAPAPTPTPAPMPTDSGLLSTRCPNCGHPIDLLEANEAKSRELCEARKRLVEYGKMLTREWGDAG